MGGSQKIGRQDWLDTPCRRLRDRSAGSAEHSVSIQTQQRSECHRIQSKTQKPANSHAAPAARLVCRQRPDIVQLCCSYSVHSGKDACACGIVPGQHGRSHSGMHGPGFLALQQGQWIVTPMLLCPHETCAKQHIPRCARYLPELRLKAASVQISYARCFL
jgi:hypothetical protein